MINRLLQSTTARSSSWLLLGLMSRVGFQLLAFILLARKLGAEGFGLFNGVVTLATLLAFFVELGGYSLIVRDLQVRVSVRRTLGTSLGVSALALAPVMLVFIALKPLLFPSVSWGVVLALALATMIGSRLYLLASGVWLGREDFSQAARLDAGAGFALLLAALVFYVLPGAGLEAWVWFYLGQGLGVALLFLVQVVARFGWPEIEWSQLSRRAQESFYFSVGAAAQGAFNDLDKTLLLRLAGAESAGVYGAASRLLGVAYVPLTALFTALYPRFFREGREGLAQARRFAWRVLPMAAIYSTVVAWILWLAAPLLPLLLGSEFVESAIALRWLVFIILLQAIQHTLGYALTGAGLQPARTLGQLGALLINVALNLSLIPRYGWGGAAIAAALSNFLLSVYLFGCLLRREQPT